MLQCFILMNDHAFLHIFAFTVVWSPKYIQRAPGRNTRHLRIWVFRVCSKNVCRKGDVWRKQQSCNSETQLNFMLDILILPEKLVKAVEDPKRGPPSPLPAVQIFFKNFFKFHSLFQKIKKMYMSLMGLVLPPDGEESWIRPLSAPHCCYCFLNCLTRIVFWLLFSPQNPFVRKCPSMFR